MTDEEAQEVLTLSAGQLAALQNLAEKQEGGEVDWINIADARALTELGLAERSQEGWQLTAAGLSASQAADSDPSELGAPGGSEHNVIQIRRIEN